MKVIFRVDGGQRLGLGHVNRCTSIADELIRKKVKCLFITSNYSTYEILRFQKYQVRYIKPQKNEGLLINKILKNENCHKIVFDSKKKTLMHILERLSNKIRIIVIDNPALANHADLLIIPGPRELLKNQKPENLLIGFEYICLNMKFEGKTKQKRDGSILFSAGSSDKYNITYDVVSSFASTNFNFKMKIVLGRFYRKESQIRKLVVADKRFSIFKDPPEFIKLMKTCSIGLITFGITAYETAANGLPTFTIAHNNENNRSAKIIEKYGWSKHLGKFDSLEYKSIPEIIISTLQNKSRLDHMSNAGNVVDGKGPRRIARIIMKM